jgi:VWFA-related protein
MAAGSMLPTPPSTARIRTAVLAAALAIGALSRGAGAIGIAQSPQAAATPGTRIEVVVVDKDGRPVEGLRPADLTVTIDGVARPVVSVRRVSRGPGAMADAGRRQGAAGPGLSFAAEPVRNVMVIVDQALIVRGDEKAAVQASRAFLDRLGLGDRVAVVRLPFSADQRIELTTERPAAREALAQVRGQASGVSLARPDSPAIERPAVVTDPDQVTTDTQPPRQDIAVPDIAVGAPEAELARARNSLTAVTGILRSLQPFPGRKVIAVFSPGFNGTSTQDVADASAAAIGGGAAIYAFGLPSFQVEPQSRPDTAALQALAKNTGGNYVMLGGKPEKAIEQTMDDLLSVYVIGLAPAAGDLDGKRRPVKVQTSRKDITVRAPLWLLPVTDPGDAVPADEAPAPPAADGRLPLPAAAARDARAAAPSGKDAELPVALARLFDYVHAYESQYSALVAEEEFRQTAGQKSVRMRSDLLLVQQESAGGWVSFRDVFEVNGAPVRDREDRLKKLFLDPGVGAREQLRGVIEDSARYNIGPLERNINVPLFLLKFLAQDNRSRSRFRIGARDETDGVRTWRVDFTEIERPTIISDRNDRDVPAKGYFLVEQSTGAIMETGLKVDGTAYMAEIVVRFTLDPGLGMWVPSRMNETYRTARTSLGGGGGSMGIALEGTAHYSKFRRFQVKTEETVTIKK